MVHQKQQEGNNEFKLPTISSKTLIGQSQNYIKVIEVLTQPPDDSPLLEVRAILLYCAGWKAMAHLVLDNKI